MMNRYPDKWMFGYMRDSQMQRYAAIALATKPKTICDVGFNGGHSAAMWLTASPDARVYAFDLDAPFVGYTRPAAALMQELFGKRFLWMPGRSQETLPTF